MWHAFETFAVHSKERERERERERLTKCVLTRCLVDLEQCGTQLNPFAADTSKTVKSDIVSFSHLLTLSADSCQCFGTNKADSDSKKEKDTTEPECIDVLTSGLSRCRVRASPMTVPGHWFPKLSGPIEPNQIHHASTSTINCAIRSQMK